MDRYHRQMLLPGFGEAGQRRLLEARALLIGCGALGTVIADQLARAGVGKLVIADRDFVELTNLQRQVLFDEKDLKLGLPKAEAAKRKIAAINSQIDVRPVVEDINHTNIEKLLKINGPVDIILDGVDNFETRLLINDAAVKHAVPYIYGGAVGTTGMSFSVLPHTPGGDSAWEASGVATPCLRCLFEEAPPPGLNPTCETAGVLGSVVSVVASHQVTEALKVLTGNFANLRRELFWVDLWQNRTRSYKLDSTYRAGDCPCCGQRQFKAIEGAIGSVSTPLCGRNAVQVFGNTPSGSKIDLEQLGRRLFSHGPVRTNPFMLQSWITDAGQEYELTVFSDGRAIIKGTTEPATARSIYAKYVGS